MKSLEAAFELIKKGDMFVVKGSILKEHAKGITDIVIRKLWNGKIAVYNHMFGLHGYTVFASEESFWESVVIDDVMFYNPSTANKSAIKSALGVGHA